jgi:glyoxalase family protein
VTALARDPGANVEFYARALGLRLVKKTVNFDDPGTYHLYYGDERGRPGTLLTFFPQPGAPLGRRGTGQATTIALRIPENSLDWWRDRFDALGLQREEIAVRFGRERLGLRDPDGLRLELVASEEAADEPWAAGPVPPERAIRGVHAVTLTEAVAGPTVRFLEEVLGARAAGEEGSRLRFELGSGPGATALELERSPGERPGIVAAGTVHHVAWRVADEASQDEWRARLSAGGAKVTQPLDRRYFRSIYFREPGGVLFEIATDGPGFTADEPAERLGSSLKLPPWLEPRRAEIERALPPLEGPRA